MNFKTFVFICIFSTATSSFAGILPSKVAKNKKLVTAFYTMAFVDHKPQEAADQYLAPTYIQHNPYVANGKQAFTDYFVPYFKDHSEARSEIKRVIGEGNLVVLHVLSKMDHSDRGSAVVDIFRVQGGKIVEHWDVRQEIPERSANENTMF